MNSCNSFKVVTFVNQKQIAHTSMQYETVDSIFSHTLMPLHVYLYTVYSCNNNNIDAM